MRTMASVCFFVIVLIAVQEVYGNVCSNSHSILSCDECIRCGGNWCNDKGFIRCMLSENDDWCPNGQEQLMRMDHVSHPGDLVSPAYAVTTLSIGVEYAIDIHYTLKEKQKAQISIENTTQSNIQIWEEKDSIKCKGLNCTTTITAKATKDFCSASGTATEFVFATVKVGGLDEVVRLKYHVPCACGCSQDTEKKSKLCSSHGDYACGACICEPGWEGEDCSRPTVDEEDCQKRGDMQCTSNINDMECSGNGYCGPCDTCVCYTDREGSQYFDRMNYCADICMIVNTCDECLANSTIGPCDSCFGDQITLKTQYNSSLINERDELNRTVWVNCNDTINDCMYVYLAKKDIEGNIVVMVKESCNDSIQEGHTATPQVSIILGVIALLAAVAAVGGVMIWKHMTALPPPPLNNPGYQNIDAEDCVGENPLYKSPTTNFQNPTYGKW